MPPEPRVLIDATAVPANRGGVGRYVDALVAALDAAGTRLSVVCQPRDAGFYGKLAPHTDVVPGPEAIVKRTARLTWEQAALPRLVKRLGVDVVHSPHYTLPLAGRAASVVTLHDATFFTEPGLHSAVKARFFRGWTSLALRRAERCVVPSEATASELATVTELDPERVDVIPHGVNDEHFHPPSPEEVRAARAAVGLATGLYQTGLFQTGLFQDEPYVAFLGALEPRKNVPALIRGFAEAVHGRPDPPALVLAGQQGWDDRISRALDAVPPGLRVVRTGYLPFEHLAGYLGGATVVAYPSLGEGFGLPVLEAMACGAAVLTTRRLALPEVGGDAVAYCGVGAGDVAAALRELLDDQGRRAVLGAAAQRRAKDFSWGVSAERHLDAYARAARASRR